MGSITDKLQKIVDTKKAIKEAIIAKGVDISNEETFSVYPDKISEIQAGEKTETLLHGKYSERTMSETDYEEFLTDGNINVIEYTPIKYTYETYNNANYRNAWNDNTETTILNNFRDFFTTYLEYNTETVWINSKWHLKVYKENKLNGFLIKVDVEGSTKYKAQAAIWVEITPIINGELQYSPEDDEDYTYKYYILVASNTTSGGGFPLSIYQQLYFIKNNEVEAWGFGFVESQRPSIKSLIGCSMLSRSIENNEYIYIHGLQSFPNHEHSGTVYEYYIWSDRSVDFTHAKNAHLFQGTRYPGEYIYLCPLYFEEEGLICDKCFVAVGFPKITKTLSFIMNEYGFFSMPTNVANGINAHVNYARLVFKE